MAASSPPQDDGIHVHDLIDLVTSQGVLLETRPSTPVFLATPDREFATCLTNGIKQVIRERKHLRDSSSDEAEDETPGCPSSTSNNGYTNIGNQSQAADQLAHQVNKMYLSEPNRPAAKESGKRGKPAKKRFLSSSSPATPSERQSPLSPTNTNPPGSMNNRKRRRSDTDKEMGACPPKAKKRRTTVAPLRRSAHLHNAGGIGQLDRFGRPGL